MRACVIKYTQSNTLYYTNTAYSYMYEYIATLQGTCKHSTKHSYAWHTLVPTLTLVRVYSHTRARAYAHTHVTYTTTLPRTCSHTLTPPHNHSLNITYQHLCTPLHTLTYLHLHTYLNTYLPPTDHPCFDIPHFTSRR